MPARAPGKAKSGGAASGKTKARPKAPGRKKAPAGEKASKTPAKSKSGGQAKTRRKKVDAKRPLAGPILVGLAVGLVLGALFALLLIHHRQPPDWSPSPVKSASPSPDRRKPAATVAKPAEPARKARPKPAPKPVPPAKAPKESRPAQPTAQAQAPGHLQTARVDPRPPALARPRPKVAIIIDDLGLDVKKAECFFRSGIPLTYSILPFLDHSRKLAESARRCGGEVMLHLPMEPADWPQVDAGPGVLLLSMGEREIKQRVAAAAAAVPFAVGVNNHMGSAFTQNPAHTAWVMEELREHGLFFVDSRTSGRSQAFALARRYGLPALKRSVFLDNIQTPQAIRGQLDRLIEHAEKHGLAVGIAHVHPVTCQTLRKEYNYLKSKVDLTLISTLTK